MHGLDRIEHVVVVQPQRGRGQDRVAVIALDDGLLIAVADGAGGSAGGEEAAELVIARAMQARPTSGRECIDVLGTIDRELVTHPRAGESTAVLAYVTNGRVSGASVGDSAAWLVDGAGAHDLTHAQHRKPRLGHGHAVPVAFEAGIGNRTLLVATDGLHAHAPLAAIVAVAHRARLDDAARELVTLPRLRSGALPDDVAVVLVRHVADHDHPG